MEVGKKEAVIVDTDSSSYCPQNDRNSIRKMSKIIYNILTDKRFDFDTNDELH